MMLEESKIVTVRKKNDYGSEQLVKLKLRQLLCKVG